MPEFHFTLYSSRSTTANTPEFHNEILRVSQRNNAQDDLTGFLHREGAFFIQFLEGPKAKLDHRLAIIKSDERHSDFEIIQSDPIETRLFPDWQMGFVAGKQPQLSQLLDFSSGAPDVNSVQPIELIVFLANNASMLRNKDYET